MASIFERSRDGKTARVWAKDDWRRPFRGIARWSLGPAILVTPLSVYLWMDHPGWAVLTTTFAVSAATLGLVGLLFWALSRGSVTVDLKGEAVILSGGQSIPFAEIGGVFVSSYVYRQRTHRHGTVEQLRFELSLMLDDLEEKAARRLDAVGKMADEAADTGCRSLDRAALKRIDQLLIGGPRLLGGTVVRLAEHGHEGAAWSAAEALAKVFHAPLFDFSGETPLIRLWSELDMPLTRYMELRRIQPEAPGEPPDGITASRSDDRFEARWGALDPVFLLLASFAAPLALTSAIVLLVAKRPYESYEIGLVAVTAGLILGAIVRWITVRPASIRVDRQQATFRPTIGRAKAIPLDELEWIRVSLAPQPRVTVFSDDAFVSMVTNSDDQAVWLEAALMQAVHERGRR